MIAVLKGAPDAMPTLPSVVSRVARFSYGVELGCPVVGVYPPLDRSVDRCYTNPDGREMVYRMYWYLKQVCKGEDSPMESKYITDKTGAE